MPRPAQKREQKKWAWLPSWITPSRKPSVDDLLIQLEEQDQERLEFWSDLQIRLAQEREHLLDEIRDALTSVQTETLQLRCSRIVDSEYSDDPLSAIGSIKRKPGGRFNFCGISSYHKDFECLYLADSVPTAFHEKFHAEENTSVASGNLLPEDMALSKVGGFVHFSIDATLSNVIDLRNEATLRPFLDVISKIKMPIDLALRAKKLDIPVMMVNSMDYLKASLFAPNYKQWATWIDLPSHSQWLGHYAHKAGLCGIVYPSCRHENGFNVGLFPDNIPQSNTQLQLVGHYPGVPQDRYVLSSNGRHAQEEQLEFPIS